MPDIQGKLIRDDLAKWTKLVKDANIKPEYAEVNSDGKAGHH